MGKTFLVNINCSKILPDPEATHYTMFIDTSKMSVVYELVEWIRWMFSLKYCIYLMHENSVIHELEDIHLLSELKNFEIMPCGKHLCVHKSIYRTLLENLNLFVSWKDVKVHKYFLDKINQMNQKLTQESIKAHDNLSNAMVQNLITFNTETDCSKNINTEENKSCLTKNQQSKENLTNHSVIKEMFATDSCYRSASFEESSVMSACFDKKITEKENTLPQLDDIFSLSNLSRNSGNKCSETKKASNASPDKSSSGKGLAKKEFRVDQGTIKYNVKAKPIKPFSVGEILSIIRKDLDEKNMENTSQSSALTPKERDPENKISAVKNSFSVQDEVTAIRKRQRTRKRKRSRRQTSEDKELASYDLENKRSLLSLRIAKSNGDLKPQHIRFDDDDNDDDDNDNIMDSECIVTPCENKLELNSEEINNTGTSAFLKNESEELVSVLSGYDQGVLQKSEKNDAYKMGCLVVPDDEIAGGGKVIDAQDDPCDRVNQSSSSLENFLSNNSNHDLNDLLSLRQKYKNGVVIQRF